ncbi:MAG: hypothetical protein PHV82_19050 [Victivallaceae bacterium]|nr:hypothetical protein [Victivallaceae bacterium]
MKRSTMIFLFCGVISFLAEGQEALELDLNKSTFYATSRSGEKKRPIAGEKLNGIINLRDESGNSVNKIKAEDIKVFVQEEGKTYEKVLPGIIFHKAGTVFFSFEPGVKKPVSLTLALEIKGKLLEKTLTVKYLAADEHIDQSQVLWRGADRLFGKGTIGQSFITGDVGNISRIKVMGRKKKPDSSIGLPALKLYEWKDNYETTVSAPPVVECADPKPSGNLLEYKVNCHVKSNSRYYFELYLPDGKGDGKDDFIYVWRCPFYTSAKETPYKNGDMYKSGKACPDRDLMFYTFYPTKK